MDLGTWGLIISAILAVIRIYEFLRSRRLGLSIKPALTSKPEIGNDILVLNGSGTPANIYYLDLAWVERSWLRMLIRGLRKITETHAPTDISYCNITVPPHGQVTLPFSEGDYFHWGANLEQDIYLRLWVVGRSRPVWFWVTGPES